MAIVKMSKFNLYAFDSDRDVLLNRLQKFNNVHFNNIESEDEYLLEIIEPDAILDFDNKISNAKWTIDLLSKYSPKKGAIQSLKEGNKTLSLNELTQRAQAFDFSSNYRRLHNIEEIRNGLEQKISNMEATIISLKPWVGINVAIEELKSFDNTNIRIGTIPLKSEEKFWDDIKDLELVCVEKVSADKNFCYLVMFNDISEEEVFLDILKENNFTSVDIKVEGKVSDYIKDLEEGIIERKDRVTSLTKEIEDNSYLLEDFQVYYDYLRHNRLRIESSENFVKTEGIDVIEGYVPTEEQGKLIKVLDETLGNNYYIQIEEADRDDPRVPIQIKNNKFVSAFESITSMYAMPRYNEIDPTPLFSPFYFIFAGIMVGDMGYGLLMVIGALILLKCFNLKKSMREMVRFFMLLGVSTTFWGFIFGGFFGDLIPMHAFINPSEDYMIMIIMSLILGGIHIFFALGIKAYMNIRDGKPLDALFDVGFWYMALMGIIVAIVAAVMGLGSTITKVAAIIAVIGCIGIVLTGGREEKSTLAKAGWGIYALYGITSYFGDFVSYLRLMALVLSGGFIATAVNMIVRMLFAGGIFGIIFGVILLVIFQLFNMFLSYLSAYVHSARLTYVEMFNKFYEGGGIRFKNLVVESKYFNIEEE